MLRTSRPISYQWCWYDALLSPKGNSVAAGGYSGLNLLVDFTELDKIYLFLPRRSQRPGKTADTGICVDLFWLRMGPQEMVEKLVPTQGIFLLS